MWVGDQITAGYMTNQIQYIPHERGDSEGGDQPYLLISHVMCTPNTLGINVTKPFWDSNALFH